jgi:hypothetical protein
MQEGVCRESEQVGPGGRHVLAEITWADVVSCAGGFVDELAVDQVHLPEDGLGSAGSALTLVGLWARARTSFSRDSRPRKREVTRRCCNRT